MTYLFVYLPRMEVMLPLIELLLSEKICCKDTMINDHIPIKSLENKIWSSNLSILRGVCDILGCTRVGHDVVRPVVHNNACSNKLLSIDDLI